jgi:aerobic C4-dicarboxylate transport protein
VATVAVAAWEGDIDRELAHKVLDGEVVPAQEGGLSPAAGAAVAAS